MKPAIVYVSGTGNTKLLAQQIQKTLGECAYVGGPSEEALGSETLYVGFWTAKFTCTPDIQSFLEKLEHKKVFLFGTAGYDDAPEYFDKILNSVAAHLGGTNQIVGRFMCQAKVSGPKKKMLETTDPEKYRAMLDKLARGDSRPDQTDLERLSAMISG